MEDTPQATRIRNPHRWTLKIVIWGTLRTQTLSLRLLLLIHPPWLPISMMKKLTTQATILEFNQLLTKREHPLMWPTAAFPALANSAKIWLICSVLRGSLPGNRQPRTILVSRPPVIFATVRASHLWLTLPTLLAPKWVPVQLATLMAPQSTNLIVRHLIYHLKLF